MKFVRSIRGGPNRLYVAVRNVGDADIGVGGAALWAFGHEDGNAFGDAVHHPGMTGYSDTAQVWRLAGIVVESTLYSGGCGLVQVYGVVDSVWVSNWNATYQAAFPTVLLRPVASAGSPGICSASTWLAAGYSWAQERGGALYAAASKLNTSTPGDATTGTGYIRGFIRML